MFSKIKVCILFLPIVLSFATMFWAMKDSGCPTELSALTRISKDSIYLYSTVIKENSIGQMLNGDINVDTIMKSYKRPYVIAKGTICNYENGVMVVNDERLKRYVYVNEFYDMLPDDIEGKKILIKRCYHLSYKYQYKIY